MFSYIKTRILPAALAGVAATWLVAARAGPLDQIQESSSYSLVDALIPYAQRDYVRALELLAPIAARGNAVAQLKLGIIFSRGKVHSPDHAAALRWFTEAARQGEAEAQFELGRMYREGLGTPSDGRLAVYWLARAAEKNVPHAINALGELYLGHPDVPPDFAVARSWFFLGANMGNAASMYNLGVLYGRGQGVDRDDIEAFKWFELAASMGVGNDRDKALSARMLLAEQLTPVEVSWGEGRVEDWSRAHLSISVR
jgi:TPR repeat protein